MSRKLRGVLLAVGVAAIAFIVVLAANRNSEGPVVTALNEPDILAADIFPTDKPSFTADDAVPHTLLGHVTFTEAPDTLLQRGYTTVATAYYRYDGGLPIRFNIAEGICPGIAEYSLGRMVSVFQLLRKKHPAHVMTTFFIEYHIDNANVRRRYIYNNLSMERFNGLATYLYFLQPNRYTLPAWLASGIEDYLLQPAEAAAMTRDDLALWLQINKAPGMPLFGDAFFVGSFGFYDAAVVRNIAYTTVRLLSEEGVLWDWVSLALADREGFIQKANGFFRSLAGSSHEVTTNFFYHFGTVEIWTPYGIYNYIAHGYDWPWEQVQGYNKYMDAAILFVREWLEFDEPGRITVELNPFSSRNTNYPVIFQTAMITHGEVLGLYGNFGYSGKVLLTNASYGLYVLTHEIVHAIHLQITNAAPAWVTEGLAVAGESLFRQRYYDFIENLQVYHLHYSRTLDSIHLFVLIAEGLDFFFRMGTEPTFGRLDWTYEDAGSFFTFLYRNYSRRQFLYFISNATSWNQHDLAYNTFGKTLEEIMYDWRNYLWPCGEPEGWWAYRVFDPYFLYIEDIDEQYEYLINNLCYCWEKLIPWFSMLIYNYRATMDG